MKKIFSIIFLLFFSLINTSLSKESNVIKIGTSANYPPFEYYENGKIVGFDVDIINTIASKLNLKVKIIDVPFSTLFTEIEKNKIDLIVAGVTITDERKKTLDFTEPYYEDKTVFIVNKNNDKIKSVKDLEGKKIGTQLGTTQDNYADTIKNAENMKFKDISIAMLNLSKNKVDVVITDKSTTGVLLKNYKNSKIVEGLEIIPATTGIVVNKNNKELLNKINIVLKEMKKSGELKKLTNKWKM